MLSRPQDYRRQGHHRQVVDCALLVAGRHPTPLLQTQNAALHPVTLGIVGSHKDHRTPAKTPCLLALLPLVPTLRDQRRSPPTPQRPTTTRVAVACVGAQPPHSTWACASCSAQKVFGSEQA